MTRNNESGMFLHVSSISPKTSEITSKNAISDKLGVYPSVRGIAFELLVSLKKFDSSLNLRTVKSQISITATKK